MGLPEEFSKYLKFVRNLQFEDKPDYNQLRQFFKAIMIHIDCQYDGAYDWILKREGKQDLLKKLKEEHEFGGEAHKRNSPFEE